MKFTLEQITQMIKEELETTLSEDVDEQERQLQQNRVNRRIELSDKISNSLEKIQELAKELHSQFAYVLPTNPEQEEALQEAYDDLLMTYGAFTSSPGMRDLLDQLESELSD
jgi:ABC-type transporter Mla subunit MlaD